MDAIVGLGIVSACIAISALVFYLADAFAEQAAKTRAEYVLVFILFACAAFPFAALGGAIINQLIF